MAPKRPDDDRDDEGEKCVGFNVKRWGLWTLWALILLLILGFMGYLMWKQFFGVNFPPLRACRRNSVRDLAADPASALERAFKDNDMNQVRHHTMERS